MRGPTHLGLRTTRQSAVTGPDDTAQPGANPAGQGAPRVVVRMHNLT